MRTPTLIQTTPLLLAVALAALTALPGAALTTPSDQGTVTVTDSGYEDATLLGPVTAAAVGETVTWTWGGFQTHSVTHGVDPTADGFLGGLAGGFDSGLKSAGSFSHTFGASGVYEYYCSIHASMRGAVVVA